MMRFFDLRYFNSIELTVYPPKVSQKKDTMKKILLIALIAIGSTLSYGQNWTGAVSSDFNNPANWDQTPQSGDDIVINPLNYTGNMNQPVISSTANFSPAGVSISGGGQLTINANLTTTDRIEVFDANSAIILNSGTFNVSGGAGNARLIFFDGSHFTMNGGTMQVGQRLLFELGAYGVQNGGTISVTETFALIDGNLLGSSYYLLNNGTLSTLEFTIENEAGIYYPYFKQSLGNLTVNGDFLALGVAPGGGRGTFEVTGGRVHLNGNILNDPTSTMNLTMKFKNGLTTDSLRVFSPSIALLSGDTLLVENHARLHFVSNLNFDNAGVLTGSDAWIIAHQSFALNGNGYYQFPSLELRNSMTQSTPAVIKLNGDFYKPNGVYVQNGKELELNGGRLQHLTLSGIDTWANLRINNTGDGIVVDAGNLAIDSNVYWDQGIVELNTSELRFYQLASSNTPSENSYAIGKVLKVGNSPFVFPVGASNQVYRPFTISAPIDFNTVISVLYHPVGFNVLSPVQSPLSSVSTLEYWEVEQINSADPVTVELGWNDATACGFVNCPSLAIAKFNGASWDFISGTTSGQCTGQNPGSITSNSTVTNLSHFTFGFTQGVYQQLVHVCYGDSIQVGSNYYDQNGTYFDVFQDQQGQDSTIVTTVNIKPQIDVSTTNLVTSLVANASLTQANLLPSYSWMNCATNTLIPGEDNATYIPDSNGVYAVIVTLQGCVDTSSCEIIDELSLSELQNSISIYPNPTTSVFHVEGLSPTANLELSTVDGKQISIQVNEYAQGIQVALPHNLPGMYILHWEDKGRNGVLNLVVQ